MNLKPYDGPNWGLIGDKAYFTPDGEHVVAFEDRGVWIVYEIPKYPWDRPMRCCHGKDLEEVIKRNHGIFCNGVEK